MGTEASVSDALIGTTIGEKYRIVRRIGEGGMGAVYEGEHTLIKRRVAIKVLRAEVATNVDIITRFHREALAATQIGNEHIVEVTDMGRLPDGGPFMVLEYLEGRDLAAVLTAGPLGVERLVHVATQICAGLAAAHERGIVHRDLKPENVFLIARRGDSDFVKLLDFGISKVLDAQDTENRTGTRTGTVMGTAHYMAPEQAMGSKELDHRADVWALGVLMYRALSGGYPFDADTYAGLLVRIVTDAPRPLREVAPSLPEAVYAVVDRCLAKKPADRFADCHAVASALTKIESAPAIDALGETQIAAPAARVALGTSMPSPAPSPSPSTVALPPSPSLVPYALAAVAALAIGALAVTFSQRTADVPPTTTIASSPDAWAPSAPDAAMPVLSHASVHVHIDTVPADATLTLDGAPMPNPFDDDLPRGADMHVLETSAPGYRTDRRDLSLLFAETLTITLTTGHGVSDTRVPHATGTRPPPSATTTTTPPETTTPPPSTTSAPPRTDALPDGVIVPPASRILKHLGSH